jgi:hypothetical protein
VTASGVGRGFCDTVDRKIAGRAGDVLDDHGLAPTFAETIANQPCRDVGRSARREADENADWLVRVILREGAAG